LQSSKALVVDACRHVVRDARTVVSLERGPVLFALTRARARRGLEMCHGTCSSRGIRKRSRPDESHRARLRVEVGRLRSMLLTLASVSATSGIG